MDTVSLPSAVLLSSSDLDLSRNFSKLRYHSPSPKRFNVMNGTSVFRRCLALFKEAFSITSCVELFLYLNTF